MYPKLQRTCTGTTSAISSTMKFMPPLTCEYSIVSKTSSQINSDQPVENHVKIPCINYKNLTKDFITIVSKDMPTTSNKNVTKLDDIEKKSQQPQSQPQSQPQPQPQSQPQPQPNDFNPFNPNYWGPGAWRFFETVAFAYPDNPTEQEQIAAKQFFNSLTELLPCEKCRKHFSQNIKTMPVNVTNKHTLSEWVTNLHNHVNKLNNKPHYDYSTVVSKYNQEGSCKSCSI